MDEIDEKILRLLAKDSSMSTTEITSEVNLSIPAVNKRIAKLKSSGVIKHFTIQVDAKKIEKNVLAFIMVILNQYSSANDFLKIIGSDPDIVECHAITGEYDYLIKVYAKDIQELESKLISLKEVKGVSKSNTLFSLCEHKYLSGPLPKNHER